MTPSTLTPFRRRSLRLSTEVQTEQSYLKDFRRRRNPNYSNAGAKNTTRRLEFEDRLSNDTSEETRNETFANLQDAVREIRCTLETLTNQIQIINAEVKEIRDKESNLLKQWKAEIIRNQQLQGKITSLQAEAENVDKGIKELRSSLNSSQRNEDAERLLLATLNAAEKIIAS